LPQPAPSELRWGGQGVADGKQQQYQGWVRQQHGEGEHHQHQRHERHPTLQAKPLGRIVRQVGHHQQGHDRGDQAHRGGRQQAGSAAALLRPHPDGAGEHRRRRRRRQAGEAGEAALGVEPGQAQGGAGDVEEGQHPARLPKVGKAPGKDDQGRRHAEGHHVRKAVVLCAEVALGAREPGHPAVGGVEHHGGQNGQHRGAEAPVHAGDGGVEAGEQGRRGDDVGQQEDAAPPCALLFPPWMRAGGGVKVALGGFAGCFHRPQPRIFRGVHAVQFLLLSTKRFS